MDGYLAGPDVDGGMVFHDVRTAQQLITVSQWQWQYLLASNFPVGIPKPAGWWNFDGSAGQLSDLSGNGNTLALNSGVAFNSYVDLFSGLAFMSAEGYRTATPGGNLLILADLTIEIVYFTQTVPSAANVILICMNGASASELEANNYIYSLYVAPDSSRLGYFSEHGAGVDSGVVFKDVATHGFLQYSAMTRDAAGNLALYRNGRLQDSAVSVLPTGGTSAYFYLGNNVASPAQNGVICSVRITPYTMTAAHIAAIYSAIYHA